MTVVFLVWHRGRELNANLFFSNFWGDSGISRQNPGISHPKVWFPCVSRDIPNFLAPTHSRGRPPPHRKKSGPKSSGLGSFFFPYDRVLREGFQRNEPSWHSVAQRPTQVPHLLRRAWSDFKCCHWRAWLGRSLRNQHKESSSRRKRRCSSRARKPQRAQRSNKFEISSEIENFERDWNFWASHPPRPYFLWGIRHVEIEIFERDQKSRSRL